MGRKKVLEKRLARFQKKLADLQSRMSATQDVTEARALAAQIDEVREEIEDCQDEIEAIGEEARSGAPAGTKNSEGAVQTESVNEAQLRNSQIVGAYGLGTSSNQQRQEEDDLATMEYRNAFMAYVQRGERNEILKFEKRADATGVASDIGVLIPTTVVQEIIKGVEKIYGQLYSRVRKTNVPGGVKYPIGSFSATFKRITETTVSDRQKGGSVTSYVEFSYNIGEIRVAQTLLQTILSVPVFEAELAKIIVQAYVEAMDKEIMTGKTADNQCEGILTEAAKASGGRIGTANIISFTADEMADWTAWQKKLFAKIPLSMRGLSPEFVMTPNTYEANIKTLKDKNDRPVYSETYNPVDGAETARFKGKTVVFVEEDILKSFDDAANNEYFGMYWVPEKAYAINSNLQFSVVRYFDQEKNQYVDKALVINDGKILDPKYIYLLKKSVAAGG